MAAALFFSSCEREPKTYAHSNMIRLVWNQDPSTTMTVAWNQPDQAEAALHYGSEDRGRKIKKYDTKTADRIEKSYGMTTHFVTLTGLESDQEYYFVIKDTAGVSERYWFRTAPSDHQPFTFIAGGDTKSSGNPLEAGRASNRLVSKLRPLFVMFNGDFTSGNGTVPERWHLWLDDWHRLTPTADGQMFPLVPVHGNHEDGDKTLMTKIFNMPYHGLDTTQNYFSLNFGGGLLHVIGLNTQIETEGPQTDWLVEDLEKHRSDVFKIAGYHKPFHPHTASKSEHEELYDLWARLFYDYKLSLSLDADSHMDKITYPIRPFQGEGSFQGFIRDDENGTLYIGEGSWGATPRPNNDDKPWTLNSGSYNQFKWIHVNPDSGNTPAHLDIYTVKTSEYVHDTTQVFYDKDVWALTDGTRFAIPANLELTEIPGYGNKVTFPFSMND